MKMCDNNSSLEYKQTNSNSVNKNVDQVDVVESSQISIDFEELQQIENKQKKVIGQQLLNFRFFERQHSNEN